MRYGLSFPRSQIAAARFSNRDPGIAETAGGVPQKHPGPAARKYKRGAIRNRSPGIAAFSG
eukprot:6407094-Alexandrium_andersonii.AAC.1